MKPRDAVNVTVSGGRGCHSSLLVSCSVVPTERGGQLCPFRGFQHWPADGEHRSNTGESVCVCVSVFVMQRTVRGVFVRMCPDLLHQALYSCLLFRNSSPRLPSTLQPLGHCCTLWYTLLYCVNKVGRISLAGGVGDKAAAISFSLDKMHPPNGLFWLVRVSLPSAHFAWLNKERACVCLWVCLGVCLLSYCVWYFNFQMLCLHFPRAL